MFSTLATLAHRRRWTVVAAALVVGAMAAILGGPVAGLLSGGGFDDPHSDSSVARSRAADASGLDSTNIIVLIQISDGLSSPSSRAAVTHVENVLHAEPDIGLVVDVYTAADPALASRDGRQVSTIGYWRALPEAEESAAAKRLQNAFLGTPGVQLGGITIAQNDVQQQVSADLGKAEMLAFPILFILLIIAFRGVVAALLPLIVGGLTIITSFLALRLVNHYDSLSIFALNLVTGLGLGLGIDYSLLVLSRYREETAGGATAAAALRRTMNTAGRTVFFSSLTVATALASLIVFPEKFLYSMAIGGVIAVVSGAVIALTVLPAILAVLGPRVDRFALRRRPAVGGDGAWYRLARFVMRRPAAVAIVSGGLLIALGLPFLRIQFTSVDASVLPTSYVSRQVSDTLIADFPPAQQAPINIVISAPGRDPAAVQSYAARLGQVAGVAAVTQPRPLDAQTWEINAALASAPLSAQSRDAVVAIRGLSAPFAVLVGGQTATFVDLQASLADKLPLALGIVTIATLLVLFAATGSVVLPIKALLMNLLSLSATFGILVLIFQDGRFTGILGYTSQGALESTQPILLFAIAFGLSTDYGVFLLTRIKEVHESGAPNREAVSIGLQRTGRIITAAAALFCVAIGSFATSQIIFIKELGVGTAVAVLVDASVVRAFLVPALMALLGEWNWWAPMSLRRLHRRLRLGQVEVGPTSR